MSELEKQTEKTRLRISNIKEDLEKEEDYFKWLLDCSLVETSRLYEGLILELGVDIRTVKERNNMCGFTQSDTEPFFMVETAFVDVDSYYFTKDQKEIINEFYKKQHKVTKVRYSR